MNIVLKNCIVRKAGKVSVNYRNYFPVDNKLKNKLQPISAI